MKKKTFFQFRESRKRLRQQIEKYFALITVDLRRLSRRNSCKNNRKMIIARDLFVVE